MSRIDIPKARSCSTLSSCNGAAERRAVRSDAHAMAQNGAIISGGAAVPPGRHLVQRPHRRRYQRACRQIEQIGCAPSGSSFGSDGFSSPGCSVETTLGIDTRNDDRPAVNCRAGLTWRGRGAHAIALRKWLTRWRQTLRTGCDLRRRGCGRRSWWSPPARRIAAIAGRFGPDNLVEHRARARPTPLQWASALRLPARRAAQRYGRDPAETVEACFAGRRGGMALLRSRREPVRLWRIVVDPRGCGAHRERRAAERQNGSHFAIPACSSAGERLFALLAQVKNDNARANSIYDGSAGAGGGQRIESARRGSRMMGQQRSRIEG